MRLEHTILHRVFFGLFNGKEDGVELLNKRVVCSGEYTAGAAGIVIAEHRNPGGELNGIVRVRLDRDGEEWDLSAASCRIIEEEAGV